MASHAMLAPSAAPIWGICSGSVAARQAFPSLDSEASAEGTAAHWLAAEVLRSYQTSDVRDELSFVGKVAENGVTVTEEMAEAVGHYVVDVLKVANKHGGLQSLRIEQRVAIDRVHPDNWGTFDCSLAVTAENGQITLYVWDYKHGHGKVYAASNDQIIEYATGIIDTAGWSDLDVVVVSRIVQPRCFDGSGNVDEWVVRASDLRADVNRLHAQAHEAFAAPRFTAGRHCKHCEAIVTCDAAKRYGYELIDRCDGPVLLDAFDGAALAVEREIIRSGLKVVQNRLEAVEAEIVHRLGQGEAVGNLRYSAKPGALAWNVEPPVALAMASAFNIDAAKSAVMTPTQVIAAAPKEIRPAVEQSVKAVASRKSGRATINNADDTTTYRSFNTK